MTHPKKHPATQDHSQKIGKGPSSYWLHNSKVVFEALALKPGEAVLDLGCGPGDYSLAAAKIVGPSGTVTSIDKWQYHLNGLIVTAACQRLDNLTAMVGDITGTLPVTSCAISPSASQISCGRDATA